MAQENNLSLVSRFGRVVHSDDVSGPYISHSGIEVRRVLDLVDAGLSNDQICQVIDRLEPKDIIACQAYRVRFLEDTLSSAYAAQDSAPFFLLDENMSYLLLPEVYRLYGRSTHVLAEGLYFQHNDDEKDVWAFAVREGCRAILTNDDDFRAISSRYRRQILSQFNGAAQAKLNDVPAVIMPLAGVPIIQLAELLEQHRDQIMEVSQGSNHATYRLTKSGLSPRDPDFLHLEVSEPH